MADRPQTILGVKISNYAGLANLGNRIFAGLTGNLYFTTPDPALADIQTATVDVETAIADWGPVGNRGSHAQLIALRDKARTLYNLLLAEANYVQNTAAATAAGDYTLMATIITSSGFFVKNNPSPQGVIGSPQDFHQVFRDNISIYAPQVRWKKPTGLLSPNNVKLYQILRNTANDFSTAVVIGTSTKTVFTDASVAHATQYYYWVRGVNTNGNGTESMVLAVATPV